MTTKTTTTRTLKSIHIWLKCDLDTRWTPFSTQHCPSRCSLAEECPAELKRSHHDAGLLLSMPTISVLRGSRTQGGRGASCTSPTNFGMHLERTYTQVVDMHFIPFTYSKQGFQQKTFALLLIHRPALQTYQNQRMERTERVCEGEKQLLCLAVFWWHSSTGATVNVLLSEQRGGLTECFCLLDRGSVTPPLSAQRRRSWPYSIRFFSPPLSFFLDVGLPFSFLFFVHLSAAKLGGEKSVVIGVGCLWMRFKSREHFQ